MFRRKVKVWCLFPVFGSRVYYSSRTLPDDSVFQLYNISTPLLCLGSALFLRCLLSPVRLLSAAMWRLIQQEAVLHYGMLEEFVSLITDTVPDLLSYRQKIELTVGLRARVSRTLPHGIQERFLVVLNLINFSVSASQFPFIYPVCRCWTVDDRKKTRWSLAVLVWLTFAYKSLRFMFFIHDMLQDALLLILTVKHDYVNFLPVKTSLFFGPLSAKRFCL